TVAAGVAMALVLAGACTGSDEDDDGGGGAAPEGDVVGHGDTYEATIRRGDGGVPHITGDSLADVTFGQGWASGEDRACDLADQVIKIRGERAEFFGPGDDDANVDSDLAWRQIGIFDRASDDWKEASGDVHELVTAFADGWNAHLDEVGVDGLPGWCQGADWVRPVEPVEVYAYARSIALYASSVQLIDYIAAARPPGEVAGDDTTTTEAAAGAPTAGATDLLARPVASNGWAIGAERSANGHGLLMANPHFPWEGELRFWEVHLTIPGETDVYGVQLSGLPGIGIGFTEDFGWTHTVSAGNRFTAYTLTLVPGKPTTYRYGDDEREMTSKDITVEVKQDDGSLDEVRRTMWSSHYGPIIDVRDVLDVPQLGWTTTSALTYRDANIDDDEILEQYLGMVQAEDFDDFIDVHREVTGIPLFNTIAVSSDGRAWYADTSATPNLSDRAVAAFERDKRDDMMTSLAADSGLVLLDGSDPEFEWQDAPGARDPGLVPFDDMPMVERDDYVFNANDSFWLPNADQVLEGDYSPLHGDQATARSPRTRENAAVLGDASPNGSAGDDGQFTLDELADAAVGNRGYTSRTLLSDVVDRCGAADAPVAVEALVDGDGDEVLPAGRVDVGDACAVLADWDGVYDLDRAGPVVWRELMHQFSFADLTTAGNLWAEPFDPEAPVDTPRGLARDVGEGSPDPALQALARAVQVLDAAGVPVDTTLGDAQFALRDGEKVPIHGGDAFDGTTNVVGYGRGWTILDPELAELRPEDAVPGSGSPLQTVDGDAGYLVDNGTSFMLALSYTDDGPKAEAFLTYGDTEDRSSDLYTEATQRFSAKDWRAVAFTEEQVDASTRSTTTVRG
ncbi:MAG TPA: penicillin acylase family protein, partial [Acidimicrobiales bacterium]|nr:penicillin acylase family protein [Acidimicrobiales bacterium]